MGVRRLDPMASDDLCSVCVVGANCCAGHGAGSLPLIVECGFLLGASLALCLFTFCFVQTWCSPLVCFIGALQSSALHLLSFLGPTLFCINFFSWAEWLRSSLPDLIARPSAWNLCRSLLLDALVQVLVTVPICTMLGSGICLVFSCCYLAAVRFLLQFSSVFVVVAGPFPPPLPRPPYY